MRVIFAALDLEAGGGERIATVERQGGQGSDIALRTQPQHARCPTRRERAESVENDVERGCAVRDRLHRFERSDGSFLVDGPKEVRCQMKRLRTCPANRCNARTQLGLEPLRRRKPRLSEGDGEEASEHRSEVETAGSLPNDQHPGARDQQHRADRDPAASGPG